MPRWQTHESGITFKSGHKAPVAASFLPVTGKTVFFGRGGVIPAQDFFPSGAAIFPGNQRAALLFYPDTAARYSGRPAIPKTKDNPS